MKTRWIAFFCFGFYFGLLLFNGMRLTTNTESTSRQIASLEETVFASDTWQLWPKY